MRQVPKNPKYLLIGGGRLARHLGFYLKALGVSFIQWKRHDQSIPELVQLLEKQNTVLLCIKDDQIGPFYDQFKDCDALFIHFSGTFSHQEILGFHPLMTFAESLYEIDQYRKIYFTGTSEEALFRQVFPRIQNPYQQITEENKSLYHSLCVLGGNGTTLLWDLVEREFSKLGLSHEAIEPYFRQVAFNIENNLEGRWTGPWYRGDQETIQKNHEALRGMPIQKLYDDLAELSRLAGNKNEKHN